MYRAILYKEWIKIRWTFAGFAAIVFAISVYIFFDVRHSIEFSSAIRNWLYIINMKHIYYSALKYIPLLGGITIGVVQFVPEVIKKRMRLSFHLPVNRDISLLFMVLIGLATNLIIDMLLYICLLTIGFTFYPLEIVLSSLITSLPWLLAGLTGYLACVMIVTEQSWLYRVLYIITGYGFISLLHLERGYSEYAFSIWKYVVIVLLFSFTILFPGYRFRRGSK